MSKIEFTKKLIEKNIKPLKVFLGRNKIHLNFGKEKRKDNYTVTQWKNHKVDILPSLKVMRCTKYNPNTREFEEYKVPYERVFRKSDIEIFVTRNTDVMKKCFDFSGANIGTVIITSDLDRILQHELQHMFNVLVGARFDEEKNEFVSYLAEFTFSKHSLMYYELLFKRECNSHKNKEKELENSMYVRAERKIMQNSFLRNIYVKRNNYTNPDEKIAEATLILLNKLYKEEIGMSYSEVLENVRTLSTIKR